MAHIPQCRAIFTCKEEAVGWRRYLITTFGFSIRRNAIFICVGQAFSSGNVGNVTFKVDTKEAIVQVYWLMSATVFPGRGNGAGWRSWDFTASIFYPSALLNAFSWYWTLVFAGLTVTCAYSIKHHACDFSFLQVLKNGHLQIHPPRPCSGDLAQRVQLFTAGLDSGESVGRSLMRSRNECLVPTGGGVPPSSGRRRLWSAG